MLNPKSVLKALVPSRVRASIRRGLEQGSVFADNTLAFIGRRALKAYRMTLPRAPAPGMDISMLCIRRPVYVRLAISSINSLHYHNHRHRVLLNLDEVCFDEFEDLRRKLDYPGRTTAILVQDPPLDPWQFTKLDVVLDSCSRGIPFVDADSRWHNDPAALLQQDRATFLVEVNKFRDVAFEATMIEKLLRCAEWVDLLHFNTGFVAIPASLCSTKFADTCRLLARDIYGASGSALFSAEDGRNLKHACEEIALSLAAQTVIGCSRIATLKDRDGPGSRTRLESYYYGALHRID